MKKTLIFLITFFFFPLAHLAASEESPNSESYVIPDYLDAYLDRDCDLGPDLRLKGDLVIIKASSQIAVKSLNVTCDQFIVEKGAQLTVADKMYLNVRKAFIEGNVTAKEAKILAADAVEANSTNEPGEAGVALRCQNLYLEAGSDVRMNSGFKIFCQEAEIRAKSLCFEPRIETTEETEVKLSPGRMEIIKTEKIVHFQGGIEVLGELRVDLDFFIVRASHTKCQTFTGRIGELSLISMPDITNTDFKIITADLPGQNNTEPLDSET